MEEAKEALIMIDMQRGFLEEESPLYIARAKKTVPACVRAIKAARNKEMPIFFVRRIYRQDGSNVELVRRDKWEAGGKPLTLQSTGALSADMPEEFDVREEDYIITKPRFSAFFQTELDMLLRRLGVKKIYIAGTTTPNCIRTTCFDGLSLDYEVAVVEDCCSSSVDKIQKANMLDMKNIGAEIIHSSELGQISMW